MIATLTANEIRQALFMRINQAQVHHDLFASLRECTTDEESLVKFNRNLRFFSGVESALFNSTIVLLYSLYERRLDTANFYQLLDQIATDISPHELEIYRARMSEIKPTWIRVNIIRNELVGHQTLERDRAAAELKAGLKFSDVEALLSHARQLLFDVSSKHFDTHVDYLEDSKDATRTLLSRVAL